MGKILECAMALAGAGSAIAPVVCLANLSPEISPNDEEDTISTRSNIKLVSSNTVFARAIDIQSRYKNFGCLKEYFQWMTWTNNSGRSRQPSPVSKFNKDQTSGCLVIRQQEGNFKLVWSMSDQSKGLITEIDLKKKESKWEGKAFVYFLKSNANFSNNWVIENSKDIRKPKERGLETWLPPYEELMKGIEEKEKKWNLDAMKHSGTWRLSKGRQKTNDKQHEKLEKWFKDRFGWDILKNLVKDMDIAWSKTE